MAGNFATSFTDRMQLGLLGSPPVGSFNLQLLFSNRIIVLNKQNRAGIMGTHNVVLEDLGYVEFSSLIEQSASQDYV